MFGTIVAVLGTLAGVLLTGVVQDRAHGRAVRAERAAELRRDQVAAVTALSTAVSNHRRAMYMRGDARLAGEPDARVAELRAESHATRAAVQEPLVQVRLLIADPAVRAACDAMLSATYGMRQADGTTDAALTREGLTASRLRAVEAHDAFVDAAAAYLG